MNPGSLYNRILYATDLGGKMHPVLNHAMHLARVHDAKIIMYHSVAPIGVSAQAVLSLYLPEDAIRKIEGDNLDQVIVAMKARLDNYYKEEQGSFGDLQERVIETVVHSGKPGESIVGFAEANNTDLIVLGSQGGRYENPQGIGSTARYVTLHSQVPVLIVPNS